ncbi:MFS transporter [Streptomyces platensis]|uniref:MFS transporter n=1 Tax=Streptomyces platensis TaxID=58346 RepID=UPI0036AD116B
MTLAETPADPPVPLQHNRDFRMLWGGAGLALLGGRTTAFAYPLMALWATGSSRTAGLVGFALLLPLLLMQLPGGALVDRCDRRQLMLCCGAGSALVGAGVAAALLSGTIWLPHLLASAFAEGSLMMLYQLAERAAVPALVTPEQLPAALVRNEARTRAASVLGQPIGSGLAGVAVGLPFLFASLAQVASLGFLARARGPFQEASDIPRRSLASEMREGLTWLWGQRFLRAVIAAVAVTNVLFQGLNLAVMAAMKDDGRSALSIGLVTMLSGVGGLVGSLNAGRWMRWCTMRTLVVSGLVVWTVLMVPVAGLHHAVALGALFAASGYVGGVFNVAAGVLLSSIAPSHMQGRANSVVILVGSGAMAVGPLITGFLLDAVGSARTVLILSAVMGVTAALAAVSPGVRAGATLPHPARRQRAEADPCA